MAFIQRINGKGKGCRIIRKKSKRALIRGDCFEHAMRIRRERRYQEKSEFPIDGILR
jgi:hypothetical protein